MSGKAPPIPMLIRYDEHYECLMLNNAMTVTRISFWVCTILRKTNDNYYSYIYLVPNYP